MKYFGFVVYLFYLLSCSRQDTLGKYYQIVDSADKIVYYNKINDNFIAKREAIIPEHLKTSKSILKRNIKIQEQKNLIPTNKIELYKNNKIIGTLLISDFVDFQSPGLEFSFPLTYGIGMSL